MDSNTHSTSRPDQLAALAAAVDGLAAHDLDRLGDAALAERVMALRGLVDRLEGHWLGELAAVDARGAAGAEQGVQAGSTAAWLRNRLRMGPGTAAGWVRTARALFRGPLAGTAKALTNGELSAAHASVLAHGTHDLPAHTTAEAEPVLLEAARRLDPPRLRRVVAHLRLVADPDGAGEQAERRHQQRGPWLAPTWEGMVAIGGLLEPEAGRTLVAALEPLARPSDASDERSAGQRRADALTELARRNLESGRLPQSGGVRPQLTVTVDLNSLLGRPDTPGGDGDDALPLHPETCRRLACDGALTRVLVTRQPPGHGGHGGDHGADHRDRHDHCGRDRHGDYGDDGSGRGGDGGLEDRLRAAVAMLPPVLGGAPAQPLEVGRTSRVVTAPQRAALVVRDGGCAFPGCSRPPAWCEAHHLRHWLHGGATDLANLALLCRAHHRAVHEGGWRLQRHPDSRLTASPPHRKHRAPA
jgi:hypothetical protein